MKILLTHGYFLNEDAAEQKIMMPYPPQGILHLHAFLQQNNILASVLDSTFLSLDELMAEIDERRPDILGIYCNLVTRVNIVRIIRNIRNDNNLKKTIIVAGGPDVRHHSENYLTSGANYCVIGEGEETFLELVARLSASENDLNDIPGIVFREEDGTIIGTSERPLIKNIADLPFPDFDRVPIEKYFKAWKDHHGHTSMTISTMRGCPYTCRWCSKAVFGNTYRRRSAEKVVEELYRLTKKYHPDRFWFVDDVFTISKSWLLEFLKHLEKNDLQICYECITRADKMDAEIIELLRTSGCFRVWIGAESGSQKILDHMDRRVEADMVRKMITESKKAGIETGTFIMLGYPGETIEDIRETVRHLKLANPDHFTYTLAYPIKGTGFYDEVSPTALIPEEWGTYTDRDIDFKRTYPGSFYKHALRYLNHELAAYRLKQGSASHQLSAIRHKFICYLSLVRMYLKAL